MRGCKCLLAGTKFLCYTLALRHLEPTVCGTVQVSIRRNYSNNKYNNVENLFQLQ